MSHDISGFRGEYSFLSNFYPCSVRVAGFTYKSSEAAFQACKTTDLDLRRRLQTVTPTVAKRLGRKLDLREGWEDIKLEMMELCLLAKFQQNSKLAHKLVETGECNLVEFNTWGDTYWGVTEKGGQNHLGKLLMQVRDNMYLW